MKLLCGNFHIAEIGFFLEDRSRLTLRKTFIWYICTFYNMCKYVPVTVTCMLYFS